MQKKEFRRERKYDKQSKRNDIVRARPSMMPVAEIKAMKDSSFTFCVPSGIGDISWLYSKLVNWTKSYSFIVCGDQPRRSLPFVELLPNVVNCQYGDFSFEPTFRKKKLGLPVDTNLNKLAAGGTYYLSCNNHVDEGGKLADFLPDLPTTYHYEINLPKEMKKKVNLWIRKNEPKGPLIGIYTSKYNSYRGDWKFWSYQDWGSFIQQIYDMIGATFVFIGAGFDLDLGSQVVTEVKRRKIPHINLVGQTHIGEVWHLISKLDYLFAYASGIGILGDVIDTPTTHYLPTPRHDALCDTYADPKNIKSGRHINKLFCSVDEGVRNFKERGLQWIDGA